MRHYLGFCKLNKFIPDPFENLLIFIFAEPIKLACKS